MTDINIIIGLAFVLVLILAIIVAVYIVFFMCKHEYEVIGKHGLIDNCVQYGMKLVQRCKKCGKVHITQY